MNLRRMQRLWTLFESRLVTPPDHPPRMKVTPLIVPFVGHYLYGVERVEVVPWAWNQVVMHEFGHYYDDVMLVQFSPLGQEIMNVLKVSEWDHRAREKFATALGMIAHRPWRYRPTNAIHRLVRPLVKD